MSVPKPPTGPAGQPPEGPPSTEPPVVQHGPVPEGEDPEQYEDRGGFRPDVQLDEDEDPAADPEAVPFPAEIGPPPPFQDELEGDEEQTQTRRALETVAAATAQQEAAALAAAATASLRPERKVPQEGLSVSEREELERAAAASAASSVPAGSPPPASRPAAESPSDPDEKKRREELNAEDAEGELRRRIGRRQEAGRQEAERKRKEESAAARPVPADPPSGMVTTGPTPASIRDPSTEVEELQEANRQAREAIEKKEEAARRAAAAKYPRRGGITSASPSAPKPAVSVSADSSKPTLSLDTKPKTPTVKVAGADDKFSGITFSGERTSPKIEFSGPAGAKPRGPEVGTKKGDKEPEDRSEERFEELSWATIGKMFRALFKRIAGPAMDKFGIAKTVLAAPKFLVGAAAYAIGGIGGLFSKDEAGAKAVKDLGRAQMVESLKDVATIPVDLGKKAIDGAKNFQEWWKARGKKETPEKPGEGGVSGKLDPLLPPKSKTEHEESPEGPPFAAVRHDYERGARDGHEVTPHPANEGDRFFTPEHDREVGAAGPMTPPAVSDRPSPDAGSVVGEPSSGSPETPPTDPTKKPRPK